MAWMWRIWRLWRSHIGVYPIHRMENVNLMTHLQDCPTQYFFSLQVTQLFEFWLSPLRDKHNNLEILPY